MAAHLDGRPVSVLDFTALAQKGGSVLSHLRIGVPGQPAPAAVRIDWQRADTLVACRHQGTELSAVFRERHKFKPGDKIRLKPNPALVHLFDEATGKRVNV